VGSWQIGEEGSEAFESAILDAKMKGFRVVFIIFVPLMVSCMLGSLFVADMVLMGDKKQEEEEEEGPSSMPLTDQER